MDAAHVDLTVFDLRGRLVRTLANRWFPGGEHGIDWDGTNAEGSAVPSGVYYARFRAGSREEVIRLVRLPR
jgi:flagellar hook assembly protein FlgD